MILNVNDERQIQIPTTADLEREIQSLQADQYLILSKDEEWYIQTYLNEDGSWDLEYRNGSADEHYAADGEINADIVASAFSAYVNADDFENSVLWLKLEMPEYDEDGLGEDGGALELGEDGELDWQKDIDASQSMTELELKGSIFQRIPHGSESSHATEVFGNCDECNVLPGQFHVLGCEQEECPNCQGFLMECDCLEMIEDAE